MLSYPYDVYVESLGKPEPEKTLHCSQNQNQLVAKLCAI